MTTPSAQSPLPVTAVDAARLLGAAISQVQRVIAGQGHMVQQLMAALLAKGHCLLGGVPSVAKTLAVRSFAIAAGGDFARVQFTPDLVPSGIVGTRIYPAGPESFEIKLGPVFVNFVLVDEANRAPAKVQSVMLELMAEKQVSTGGRTYSAPEPFIMTAIQNPVEPEGVCPLPEAQRGRPLVKVDMLYPKGNEELKILRRMGVKPSQAEQVLNPGPVRHLQGMVSKVFVHNLASEYIVHPVLVTRNSADFRMPDLEPVIQTDCSLRATPGLVVASCSLALINGRDHVLPIDVQTAARDVMSHRIVLGFDVVTDNVLTADVVDHVLVMAPAPTLVWNDQSCQQRHQQHGYQSGHA